MRALFVVVVALVLSSILLFTDLLPSGEHNRRARLDSKDAALMFPGLTPEQLSEVKIQRNTFSLTVSRSERRTPHVIISEWSLKGVPVEKLPWNSFLNTLSALRYEHAIDSTQAVATKDPYGFEETGFEIRFLASSKSHGVRFGSRNEISGRRYAQRIGEPGVFLVSDEQVVQLDRKEQDIYLAHPIQFPKEIVRQVTLRMSNAVELHLERSNEARWTLRRGLDHVSADSIRVQELLEGMQRARVIDSSRTSALSELDAIEVRLALEEVAFESVDNETVPLTTMRPIVFSVRANDLNRSGEPIKVNVQFPTLEQTLILVDFPYQKLKQPPLYYRSRTPLTSEWKRDDLTSVHLEAHKRARRYLLEPTAAGMENAQRESLIESIQRLQFLDLLIELAPGERFLPAFEQNVSAELTDRTGQKWTVRLGQDKEGKFLGVVEAPRFTLYGLVASSSFLELQQMVEQALSE